MSPLDHQERLLYLATGCPTVYCCWWNTGQSGSRWLLCCPPVTMWLCPQSPQLGSWEHTLRKCDTCHINPDDTDGDSVWKSDTNPILTLHCSTSNCLPTWTCQATNILWRAPLHLPTIWCICDCFASRTFCLSSELSTTASSSSSWQVCTADLETNM
jgi:hypothetical protein